MNEKRSVKSYLLSIFLFIDYIFYIFYTIWSDSLMLRAISLIIIIGILVVFTLKRSIISSLMLVIFEFISLDFFHVFINFINGSLQPYIFFIDCLQLAFPIAIFIDIVIEKGYKYKGVPKKSFYYTETDYEPRKR